MPPKDFFLWVLVRRLLAYFSPMYYSSCFFYLVFSLSLSTVFAFESPIQQRGSEWKPIQEVTFPGNDHRWPQCAVSVGRVGHDLANDSSVVQCPRLQQLKI